MGRQLEKLAEENNGLKAQTKKALKKSSEALKKAQTNRSKGAYDCCICMEKTSDTNKLAVLLPCAHTICEDCSAMMQGQPCPKCRRNSTYSVVVQDIYE